MYDVLGKNWWALAIRGVAAVLFGILAIFWPVHILTILVLLFGAYALIDGIFALVAAFRAMARHLHWVALVLEGILGILVGIISLFHPGLTATVIVYFIAAWAVITGVLELIAAVRLRREIEGEIFLALAGAVSLIFGILLFIFPSAAAIVVIWILGIYALIFGVLMIILSLRLRSLRQGSGGSHPQAAPGPA